MLVMGARGGVRAGAEEEQGERGYGGRAEGMGMGMGMRMGMGL